MVQYILKKIVGTKNERELRKLHPRVAEVNALEAKVKALSDDDFPRRIAAMKQEVASGRPLDELLPESFALTREAARRVLGQRHYDVQLIGGMVLHSGKIAEMKTGEGKTLVATLPATLNALAGRGVHVVTVNDYLARRDSSWMGRVFKFLGLSTGVIVHGLTDAQRQEAYGSDITYGQNNEFGFDYLRDNMKFRLRDYVQRELNYAIVDEVDSILIDEARTPLIISGPSDEATDKYARINVVVQGLVRDRDYAVDEKARSVMLTDDGVEVVEKRLGISNLYDPEEIETLHHVEQGLRAHTLYRNEVDYVVKEGEVIIVDEFTGRLMPGRRWSDGLHQAIEAKEGVKVEAENQTLATISFQNYFRMYTKLSGMTGTADTEAEEFAKIYNLDVMVVPTHRPMVREDREDVVYKTEGEKFKAVVNDIEECHKKGQPVLVGTVSIAKSEALTHMLKKTGIPHHVLNAKHHEREAEIVAQAGRFGAVTISTNMAGRGTDIVLGGNAEAMARHEVDPDAEPERYAELLEKYKKQCAGEREQVTAAGGLHILGTERHESRRIDNQLRGRSGRQGDPGSSHFFLSLEDDLMRIFGSDRISGLMERLGMEDDEPIYHPWLSRSIEGAQRRVEGHNFDIRKNLLDYDDVMNQQRRTIYALRREVLAAGSGLPFVLVTEDPKTRVKTRTERMVSWEDQRERALDLFEDVILGMLDEVCPPRARPETWDMGQLRSMVKEQFNIDASFEGSPRDRAALEEQVYNVVERAYLAKEQEITPDQMRRVEQYFYLSTIDQLWKDHLLAMDHLRQGIGLRGYGQKDPKQEYKKEGYNLFVQMMLRIRQQVAGVLLRVQPKAEQAPDLAARARRPQRTIESHPSASVGGDGKAAAGAGPVTRQGPKLGRNDPCHCGSGKKYKKCHLPMEEGIAA